ALAAANVIGLHVAMGLVLGANIGSGILAMINTMSSPPEARRINLGNLLFRMVGCLLVIALLPYIEELFASFGIGAGRAVVDFPPLSTRRLAAIFLFPTEPFARLAERLMPHKPDVDDPARPRYLDPSALDTPALAIGNAAREAIRIGDVIEQ